SARSAAPFAFGATCSTASSPPQFGQVARAVRSSSVAPQLAQRTVLRCSDAIIEAGGRVTDMLCGPHDRAVGVHVRHTSRTIDTGFDVRLAHRGRYALTRRGARDEGERRRTGARDGSAECTRLHRYTLCF